MKLFTQWRFILLSALFSLLGIGSAWAQLAGLEVGKVYHFTNARYPAYAMGVNASEQVRGITPINKSDFNQLWRVAEKDASGNYRLQSLGHGGYLQAKGQDIEWLLVDKNTTTDTYLVLDKTGSYNIFRGVKYNGGYGWANVAAGHSYKILGWTYNNDLGSQWTIEEVELDETALNKALDNQVLVNSTIRKAVTTALSNLFTDVACTTAKKSLTVAALESDADYQALTPTLQKMAKKVYSTANDAWTESNFDNNKNAWDNDYAKKYRVQLYEPYNEPECAAAALGINAHTNLNNPTGIFANQGDVLFVMVESEIEEGASLYLSHYVQHNMLGGYDTGIELHKGLNVVQVPSDNSNYCINYVVKTFDTSKGKGSLAKARKLSDYDPIKIHIEGGYINGYWNRMGDDLYTADTDNDWNYLEARATQHDLVVLGKYMTLQFPLLSVNAEDHPAMSEIYNEQVSVSASIAEWDNIMLWERFVMGLSSKAELEESNFVSPYSQKDVFEFTGEDYTDYYNIHGLAIGIESNKNPHAGWAYSGYPNSGLVGYNVDILTSPGAHWTAGHEIGHQHQGPLNMRGLTEVTNNLFSNVVFWCFGEATSRYNGTDAALSNVLAQFNAEGTDFFSNNIWACSIMYYKLFLYYHVLGHNPKFYPTLFEMLRQDPMKIEYGQDGSKCLLHFYKLCCEAADEDLTEFFRAHGFFRVMEDRFVGDYSNAVYNMTQTQIDAAIAEVKAMKNPENISVLFINDATGETIKSHKGDNLNLYNETRVCAELGSYASFATATTPSYNYTISGNTVTMEGTGGVGFAILNKKGELIGFSDKKTFNLSLDAMETIANGEATFVAVNGDNTTTPTTYVGNLDDTNKSLLGDFIQFVETNILPYEDTTGKKIGYYRRGSLTALRNTLTEAQRVYNNELKGDYVAVFNALKQEYNAFLAADYNEIPMTAGTFLIKSCSDPSKHLCVNNENSLTLTSTAESDLDDTAKWVFEKTGDGKYYIKNLSTKKYIGALTKDNNVPVLNTTGADAYDVVPMGTPGEFALAYKESVSFNNSTKGVIGWGYDGDRNSWWYITIIEPNALDANTTQFKELLDKTRTLFNEMAIASSNVQEITLTEDSYYCNAPQLNGAYEDDNFKSYSVLCDNDKSTHLHTAYGGTNPGTYHYLRVDLGEENKTDYFTFTYSGRSNTSNQNPTAITIEGCNSADGTYEPIIKLTQEVDGLIKTAGGTYVSDLWGNEGKIYRYLRFTVTETMSNSKFGDYPYFVFSEFGVSKANFDLSVKSKYASEISDADMKTVFEAIRQAMDDYRNATTAEDYERAYDALNTHYETLLNAYNAVKEAGLEAKKAELQTLIDNTTTLIGQCGSVNYIPGTFDGEAPLQTTNVNSGFYLSTNAPEPKEGAIGNLLDADMNSFFHSAWSVDISAEHYLLVDVGEGNELKDFTFSYQANKIPIPATIKVYGSNDNSDYTLLATFSKTDETNPIPTTTNTKWTSSRIVKDVAYRYLRFNVTESTGNSDISPNPKGEYCFVMSDFDITAYGEEDSYEVSVNATAGEVKADLLLATYKENQEAQSTHYYATTEAQVDKAIADLQAQYDALLTEAVYRQELRDKIDDLAELIDKCGEVAYDAATDTYTATVDPNAGSVTEELLISAARAKTAAEEVANTSTDQAALIAEKEKLTTHCEALQAAFDIKLYPVTITTDEANPVLYTMKSRRGDNKAVQYLPADGHKFNISDLSAGSAVQAYYFTEGTERGQVYVHPYAAGGMVLAANDTGDGADKAFAAEKRSATYYKEWKFVEATVNEVTWYSLQPVGTSTYFSNYGGGSNKMGFYSTADEGSHLQFVSTTVEGSVAYNTLKSYYDGLPGTIEGNDDKVGYYPVTQAATYNQAYNQATVALTPVEGTILSADDLANSTTARVIGINSICKNKSHQWVNEQGYNDGLGLDQVISLEPVTEGLAGTYYLKVVHAGEMGYFQESGYTIGAKETAQVFVPIAASTSVSDTGNDYYNGVDWDESDKSDATKLVRFVCGLASGTDWLNPGSKTYANGKGPWTVFNVHALEFTTTEDQYFAAYEALKSAYEGMVVNMPEADVYYTIESVVKTDGENPALVYANPADNKMYWGGSKTKTNAETLWSFTDNGDGTYTVSNMHTGTMMNGFINYNASPLNATTSVVTLSSLAHDGQIGIHSNGTMMHAQGGGAIVHWGTGANDGSAWRLVKANPTQVAYSTTISSYGLSGLHLNYPVKVPNDVNAYYVSMAEGAGGIAKLTKIENGIIPANEGVILEGTENATISLTYVSGDVAAISENLLKGSNYTGYIQGEDNTKYYLFGAKSGKVGLYWTYLQYNADGTINEANTDNGGYFKCSANKVYLPYSEGSGVAKFSFRFDDTTGIDDLLNGLNGEELIYDLQGRRILKITESGIYIVNGEKRYIHAK